MDVVTRRRFLGRAAALGALAALGPRSAAAQTARTFPGTLCFFSKHLPDLGARDLAREVKALGFGGIDLTVRKGGHVAPERAAEDLPPFLAAVREQGVEVPMIATGLVSASDPTARPLLETAGRQGVKYVKLGYLRYAFRDVRAELVQAAVELRGLAELAARCGVVVGYHNHAGYLGGSVWDVAPAIEALDPRAAGYYYDVRHAVVEGGEASWRAAFLMAAPRTKMIAVKDFFWEKTAKGWQQRNCPLGEGMVPWATFFQDLAGTPFAGPLSLHLEYEVAGGTPQAQRESTLAAAARDLAFLKAGLAKAYGA
jgi:sugar phosphate isomerase/epimerase